MINKVKEFFKDIKEEINKITFPERQAVFTSTRIIALIVFFVALYMEVLDFLFKALFKYLLKISI